ncbi:nucleoside-diphosphate sugar epimerase/dehydratase [Deltaproteobacteria bacterium IMCC39524]|nr:nucleoside-diphosphate sugar epimerase/dehydratase [Deltaproteobacteria bacterium IMCC39524]
MSKWFIEKRLPVILFFQLVIVAGSFFSAFQLRFDFNIPPEAYQRFYHLLPAVIVIKLVVLWKFDAFRGWWRYVSMPDLVKIFQANVLASLVLLLYAFITYRATNIPRTVVLLDWLICFTFSGGIRFLVRAFRENYFRPQTRDHVSGKRILIVGAGSAGQSIAREVRSNPRLNMSLVGFVDDDPLKKGQNFQGIRVLGRQENLAEICHARSVDQVIIAIPSATGAQLRSIVKSCEECLTTFKTLPGVEAMIDGTASVNNIRDVELEDLLGRDPVRLETARIASYLKGQRVLVTGAAGSIGSELCRQIIKFSPAKLILFENSETPLFHIDNELRQLETEVAIFPIVGDVRNRSRVNAIFDEFMPDVVFHAAAYKHVPLMEVNPAEAVNNNVRGTKRVADAAHAFGVKHFVMVSTDKAVNPTNVMGATKRAAEMYVQSLSQRSKTHFVTVRFGNVLGSNGSVIPTFKEQIAKGGPVTVTHRDVTRYFMTIPEAGQLVLQAGSMGVGGEIFLLNMGAPVKILSLAEELIRLSGLKPYEDIEIVFSGLRPGEKLYEELLLAGEGVVGTSHEKICVARAEVQESVVPLEQLEHLFVAAKAIELKKVVLLLQQIVPEFKPTVQDYRKFDPINGSSIGKVVPLVRQSDKG